MQTLLWCGQCRSLSLSLVLVRVSVGLSWYRCRVVAGVSLVRLCVSISVGKSAALKPNQIAAGRKGLVALPAQDNRADVVAFAVVVFLRQFALQPGHQGFEVSSHFYRKGVVGFRRFQRDDSDPLVAVGIYLPRHQ